MKRKLFAIASLSALAVPACAAPEAKPAAVQKPSYAVVVSAATAADPEWKPVVDALVRKHGASVITYAKSEAEALPALGEQFPRHIAFVAKPEEADCAFIVRTNRLVRHLDADPYADAMHGVITGYTAADALRLANGTLPAQASTALLSCGVGSERFREAYYLSDGKRGEHGHKKPDGKVDRSTTTGDMSGIFIDYLAAMEPDVIITSGHATQFNLEMPFSMGNLVCKDGKLWGLTERRTLINYLSGQSTGAKLPQDKLKPIAAQSKPKAFFALGNCLIGGIPNRECMALAILSHLGVTQFVGYTYTTWYGTGANGHGGLMLRYWEQGGGYTSLNESYYFGGQALLKRLGDLSPDALAYEYANASPDMDINRFAQGLGDFKAGKAAPGSRIPITQDEVGMLWDRDCVAFYGDPSLAMTLDKEHTVKPSRVASITEDADGTFRFVIEAREKVGPANDWSSPVAAFLPRRVGAVEVLSGKELNPLITDNFILVDKMGNLEAGKRYEVVFKAAPIGASAKK